jgi:hypothetical protein
MPDCALPEFTELVEKVLEEAEDLKGTSIFWGPPTGDDKPLELIILGADKDAMSGSADREWGPIGAGVLDEALELPMAVEVSLNSGTNTKPAYTRSFEIAAAVESALRADLDLGGFLLMPAKFSALQGRFFRSDRLRGHHVFLTLTGTARI